jgi:hypothetical protein
MGDSAKTRPGLHGGEERVVGNCPSPSSCPGFQDFGW